MNTIIETRKKVYQNFPKENLEVSLADMVLLYNINQNDYQNLIEATKTFLLKTMSLVYNKEFIWTDTFLEDNEDRKSTRLNSSHSQQSRMPSSA